MSQQDVIITLKESLYNQEVTQILILFLKKRNRLKNRSNLLTSIFQGTHEIAKNIKKLS